MEIEVGDAHVWIWRDADIGMATAILRALANCVARQMIGPTGAVRVMVATKPVDFRKGAEGLAALVRETMQADPFIVFGRNNVAARPGAADPQRSRISPTH